MTVLLLLLSWSLTAVILLIAVYYLTGGLFFTSLPENSIKAIVTNGSLVRYIANVKGKQIDQSDNKLKKIEDIDEENLPILKWWEEILIEKIGLRWVGIPILRQVKKLPINRVVLKEKQSEITTVTGRLETTTVTKDELYGSFPRPFEMFEADTNDGFKLDFRLTALLEVDDPYPAFFELKVDFLLTVTSIISAYVTDVIKGLSWEEYKNVPKKNITKKVSSLFDLKELAKHLEATGVHVNLLVIEDFKISASSKRLQDAVEEEKIETEKGKGKVRAAEAEKEATIRKAEGEKRRRTLEGEGEAAAIEAIAKAKAKRYTELINTYTRMGFDGRTAAEKADTQIALEFQWDNLGKMTGTYVEGGSKSVQPTIHLGGRRNP